MRKFIRQNKNRINDCVLQHFALMSFLLLFSLMFTYMITYERESMHFHHHYQKAICTVENIDWENKWYGNFTFLIINNQTYHVTKNHMSCIDIPDGNENCINQSFTGYFNPIKNDLFLSDPFPWSMLVAMVLFGVIGLTIIIILCWTACKSNRFLAEEYEYCNDKQMYLLGM